MGSPYLIAHGLGQPVDDATTNVAIPESGKYRVWVRTIDWVRRWDASPSPGKFELHVDGKKLDTTFGTKHATWDWQDGGVVSLTKGDHTLSLKDQTGFDGRCDCIYLTTELDDHTFRFFQRDNFQYIFQSNRLEIQAVRRIVVG